MTRRQTAAIHATLCQAGTVPYLPVPIAVNAIALLPGCLSWLPAQARPQEEGLLAARQGVLQVAVALASLSITRRKM